MIPISSIRINFFPLNRVSCFRNIFHPITDILAHIGFEPMFPDFSLSSSQIPIELGSKSGRLDHYLNALWRSIKELTRFLGGRQVGRSQT